ncbi:MAG: transposase [Arsenophonus sp. NC-QC1-MAG3]
MFPGAQHQYCWVHKIAYVLVSFSIGIQAKVKIKVQEALFTRELKASDKTLDVLLKRFLKKYSAAMKMLKKSRRTSSILRLLMSALDIIRTPNLIKNNFCDSKAMKATYESIVIWKQSFNGIKAGFLSVQKS